MKSAVLTAIALLTLSLSASAAIKEISADSLAKKLTAGSDVDFLLIDLREASELSSIIATQQCRPYNLPWNSHVFDSAIPKLPKSAVLILYCRSGTRSSAAVRKLDSNGFTSAYSLTGGMSGWKGPVDSSSRLKNVADLPAPSMLKTPVRTGNRPDRAGPLALLYREGWLALTAPLSRPHALSFYSISGERLLLLDNPFRNRAVIGIPRELGGGRYLLRLEAGGTIDAGLLSIVR